MKHIYKTKSFMTKRKAFTLIELLIVIAIIGILFIVLISKVDFATDKAKATGVQTDFRSFQVAIESVAKEHAGLSTFGWDTGDTNGNRIRDSYDKGDTNQNGKQDEGEVFVGSKAYGETWTNIYTLTNPADASDMSAIAALEAAINANLDPKLHITIHDDLTITMANGAQDPWKTEYHGRYLSNATTDGKDRGAIIMYSNGTNQEFGSEHSIAEGIVTVNVPGNNKLGADDYSIATVYTYTNGYGEVKTTTTGFSNNQNSLTGNGVNTDLDDEHQNNSNQDNLIDNNVLQLETREAGLYKTGTNELIYSWDTLVEMGIIVNGRGKYEGSSFNAPTQEVIDLLKGDLQFPSSLTSVTFNAFENCKYLTGIILPKEIKTIYSSAFAGCRGITDIVIFGEKDFQDPFDHYGAINAENIYFDTLDSLLKSTQRFAIGTGYSALEYKATPVGPDTNIYIGNTLLEELIVPDGYTEIKSGFFTNYKKLKSVVLPATVIEICPYAFEGCSNLTQINLDNVMKVNRGAFYNTKIENVDLSNVTFIGTNAFQGSSLTNVHIGANLDKIETKSLLNGTKVITVQYDGTMSTWNSVIKYDFARPGNGITNGNPYELFINNQEMSGTINIPVDVTNVGDFVFSGVSAIKEVVLHENVTSIGNYSFYKTSIQNVKNMEALKTIGEYAFSETSLQNINIPDITTDIKSYAFSNCKSLTTVNITESSSLTNIGNGAFSGCIQLESLFIPQNVVQLDAPSLISSCEKLNNFTFSQNSKLEYLNVSFGSAGYLTVYLPDSVKIVKNLHIYTNGKSQIVIGQNSKLERIEGQMFSRYNGDLYIPENVSYIDPAFNHYGSPNITLHPNNQYFSLIEGTFIDIVNKRIVCSKSGYIPNDGTVVSIGQNCRSISYVPICITNIDYQAWGTPYVNSGANIVYEGTIAQWKTITGGRTLEDVASITCSDGTIDASGNVIN